MIIINSDYIGDNNDGIIQQRIGTTAEWNDAISKGIHPAKGEIIIEIATEQDPQDSSKTIQVYRSRLGIDEKVTKVEDLPLMATEGGSGVGQTTADKGEIFNSYEDTEDDIKKNIAIGKGSHAEGLSTIAGAKGFILSEYVEENDNSYLKFNIDSIMFKTLKDNINNSNERYENIALLINNNIFETVEVILSTISHDEQQTAKIQIASTSLSNSVRANLKLINQNDYILLFSGILFDAANDITKIGGHAEGLFTAAMGQSSHSEGMYAKAIGDYSHAQNYSTQAIGVGSTAGGVGTIAQGNAQTVIGKYNEIDNNNDYAFVIGNGTDESDRKNIFSVNWDGQIETDAVITTNDIVCGTSIMTKELLLEEDDAKIIAKNGTLNIKNVNISGELNFTGENSSDFITSDNFKGKDTLKNILKLPEEDNKIGDTWLISKNDMLENVENTFTNKSLHGDAKQLSGGKDDYNLNGNRPLVYNNEEAIKQEILTIGFELAEGESSLVYENIVIPATKGKCGLKLIIPGKEEPYKIVINNALNETAHYFFDNNIQNGLITISQQQLKQSSNINFLDLIKSLYYYRDTDGCFPIVSTNLLDDNGSYIFKFTDPSGTLHNMSTIIFKFYQTLSDWEQKTNETSAVATREATGGPKIEIIDEQLVAIIIPQNHISKLDNMYTEGLFHPKLNGQYNFLFELIGIENQTKQILLWPKNDQNDINRIIPTMQIVEVENLVNSEYINIKPNDQAVWFNDEWNFIASPYSNIGSPYAEFNSLLLNDIKTNIANADYSVISGQSNTDDGGWSLIGGSRNKNFGAQNLIWGQGNYAISTNSLVFGYDNINEKQKGDCNFIIGHDNKFESCHNAIIGNNNIIEEDSDHSVLLGDHLKSSNEHQYILGKYNNIAPEDIFVIGNGSSDAKQNLFQIKTTGQLNLDSFELKKINTDWNFSTNETGGFVFENKVQFKKGIDINDQGLTVGGYEVLTKKDIIAATASNKIEVKIDPIDVHENSQKIYDEDGNTVGFIGYLYGNNPNNGVKLNYGGDMTFISLKCSLQGYSENKFDIIIYINGEQRAIQEGLSQASWSARNDKITFTNTSPGDVFNVGLRYNGQYLTENSCRIYNNVLSYYLTTTYTESILSDN